MASDNKFTPAGPVAGKFGQLGPLTDNRFDRPSGNPANPDQPIPVFSLTRIQSSRLVN